VDAHHALAQRAGRAGAGDQRLAHLQRGAVLPLQHSERITLGGWLGGALQWHFAAMWLLVFNGFVYLAINIASGRLAAKFFPVTPAGIWHDALAALKGKLSHADPRRYNSVQRLAYLFVMLDIVVIVLSGLVLWKSVQFAVLRDLLGGYEFARRIHFFGMASLVASLPCTW
jgi:thiosulfate reductase cytochrome b subunit